MEENRKADGQEEEEEEESEYILLDLDAVSGQIDIPPNAPYTLSIGEYEETIGTCLVFKEDGIRISSQNSRHTSDISIQYRFLHGVKMLAALKNVKDLNEQVGNFFQRASIVWDVIGKPWNFPGGVDQNVNNLKRKREELNGQKEDTTSRIRTELQPRKKVKKEVELWLENVRRIDCEIQKLESAVGASNFLSRGFLGKNVRKKIEEVDELLEKGVFSDGLVIDNPSRIGQVLPTPSLIGEFIALKKNDILGYLMDTEVKKIGIHGVTGVGKTSVVKLVNNELLKHGDKFDIVVWVTVSRKCSIVELQNKIARAMNAGLEDEDETIRAGMLSEILDKKGKYVLILDDLRENFSLEEVGIPEPSANNGNKLVLTTRSVDICRKMHCLVINMEPLPQADM